LAHNRPHGGRKTATTATATVTHRHYHPHTHRRKSEGRAKPVTQHHWDANQQAPGPDTLTMSHHIPPSPPHRKSPSSSLPPPPPVLRRQAQSSTRNKERKETRKQQRGTTEQKENGPKTSRWRQEIMARPCATYGGRRHTLMSTASHPSNTRCSKQPPPHPLTKGRHLPPHILHPRRKSTVRHRWTT